MRMVMTLNHDARDVVTQAVACQWWWVQDVDKTRTQIIQAVGRGRGIEWPEDAVALVDVDT